METKRKIHDYYKATTLLLQKIIAGKLESEWEARPELYYVLQTELCWAPPRYVVWVGLGRILTLMKLPS